MLIKLVVQHSKDTLLRIEQEKAHYQAGIELTTSLCTKCSLYCCGTTAALVQVKLNKLLSQN